MAWLAFFALVVGIPVALLVWSRRDNRPGEEGTDPHAHHDYAADGGPTPHHGGPGTGTDSWTIGSF